MTERTILFGKGLNFNFPVTFSFSHGTNSKLAFLFSALASLTLRPASLPTEVNACFSNFRVKCGGVSRERKIFTFSAQVDNLTQSISFFRECDDEFLNFP